MPARPRRSEELLAKVQDLARTTPTPAVMEIARLATDIHYGTEIGMAYLNRGASGTRAAQLVKEFEELRMWLEHKHPA